MSKNVLNLWMIGDASESLKAKRLKFRLQLYLPRKEKFTNLAFFAENREKCFYESWSCIDSHKEAKFLIKMSSHLFFNNGTNFMFYVRA